MRLRWVALLSLIFTYAFFFEYLPPFRWVDISGDLQGFQFPLNDYAFRSLSTGHVPEWDPTMYFGMTGAIVSVVSLLGLLLCVRWPRAR